MANWLFYGAIAAVVFACGYWLFVEVRKYYRKVMEELKTDDVVDPVIAWGGDKQRDKVVHRDSRGWVSDRLVLLAKDELHVGAERVECGLVAAAMTDWSWCMDQCAEAIPELKTVRNARTRLHFALAIVLQSAIAHGDKKLTAQARRGLEAFKRKVPAM